MELGRAAREEAARLRELIKKGAELRKEYVQTAATRKQENSKQLEQMKAELTAAEQFKNQQEAIKKEAEDREKAALDAWRAAQDSERAAREEAEMKAQQEQDAREAERVFAELDADKNGLLSYFELQNSPKFDKDGDGVITDDEAKVCTAMQYDASCDAMSLQFFLHAKDDMSVEEFKETGWVIMKPYYHRTRQVSDRARACVTKQTNTNDN